MKRVGLIAGCVFLLLSSAATSVAGPPRPGSTDSGLNESEEATLWSKQPNENYISNSEYRAAYGENRTTTHQVANGTDLTFTEPPSTASRWTRFAHGEYTPGDRSTSVYPPHADTEDGRYIRDAHATVFAVSPSTNAHLDPDTKRFYVAPEGRVLGTVDYRLDIPPGYRIDNRSVTRALTGHEIDEVRLYADDEQIAESDGTHRPSLRYDVDGDVETLRLEADISATVRVTTRTTRVVNETVGNGTRTIRETESRVVNDTVTVSDSANVTVYDLRAQAHFSEYPSGKTGVSIYQTAPWQGYTLTDDGTERVRGIWRFFTARDTAWDELVRSTAGGSERTESHALPVYVHAYPSELGPRAKPEHGGPTIIELWGERTPSPKGSLPENVTVEVVESAYRPTYGMAVNSQHADPDALTVHGIVYGTEATILESPTSPREARETELSARVIDGNESGATVLLELEEAESGDPIALEASERSSAVTDRERDGYIAIADQQVKTNTTGEAVVFLSGSGTYTARYEPESWLTAYPPYAGDTDVVRWHPLTTITGWLNLARRFGMVLLPFAVALYAGRRLGAFLHWRRF